MDLFRCVVLTILFTETIGGSIFISEDDSKWTTAARECHLAEPDLIFSSGGGVTVNISVVITEEVWIGYYRARTAFEYFGCAETDNYNPKFHTKADPGQCMSACGAKKIIGIFENECFCFEQTEILDHKQTMQPYCNKDCQDLEGVVCGGPSEEIGGTTYMSLYRSIETNIRKVNEGGMEKKCMYYDGHGFNWNVCAKPYAFICGTGSSAWIANNENAHVYSTWAKATEHCFTNNTRPSTFNNTQSIPQDSSLPQLWTGIVRSHVIYKYTDDPLHSNNANKYCYLKTDGNIVLQCSKDNDKKHSLCVNVTDTMTTSFTTETSTSSVVSTTTANNIETTAPEKTSPSTPTAKSSTANALEKKGSSDLGAIVGATLSIVVIVVVVVVVAIILRKRGFRLPFIKKEKQAPSPSMIQNNTAYAISRPVKFLQSTYHTDNEEYAEIDLTTTIDNEAQNGNKNDALESSDYAHDYFVLEKPDEEHYDSTKPEDQKSDPNTYNPYNKLSFEESSNYDHVGAGNTQVGNAGRKVSDSENTYNTSSLGNSYLKTSGGESNNAYSMAEETEDTYNHTNVPRYKMGLGSSENDYDAI